MPRKLSIKEGRALLGSLGCVARAIESVCGFAQQFGLLEGAGCRAVITPLGVDLGGLLGPLRNEELLGSELELAAADEQRRGPLRRARLAKHDGRFAHIVCAVIALSGAQKVSRFDEGVCCLGKLAGLEEEFGGAGVVASLLARLEFGAQCARKAFASR